MQQVWHSLRGQDGPVHIRRQEADCLRALVGAQKRLIRLRKDLEGHICGVPKTSGMRRTGVGRRQKRQAFRDHPAAAGESDPVFRTIADGFHSAHSALCLAAANLERALTAPAKSHPVAHRLMTTPGVGPIVSLSFVALIDNPRRSCRPSDIGAFRGLTPQRHPSGEMYGSDRVSKCGAAATRGALFEAACCVIRQVERFSTLKSSAVRLTLTGDSMR